MAYPPAGFQTPLNRALVNGQPIEDELPQGPLPPDFQPPPTLPSALPPWLQSYAQMLIEALAGMTPLVGSSAGGDTRAARFGELLTGIPNEVGTGLGIALPYATKVMKGKTGSKSLKAIFDDLAGRTHLVDTIQATEEAGKYKLTEATMDRLREMYELGGKDPTKIANWRGVDDPDLLAAFGWRQGGDPAANQEALDAARLWAEFWGAMSPGTGVPKNTLESVKAFKYFLEHPDEPFTMSQLGRMGVGNRASKLNNMFNSIFGMPFSGEKVTRMRDFMLGHPGRIPIDRHALYAVGDLRTDAKFATHQKSLKDFFEQAEGPFKGKKELVEVAVYARYEQALLDALDEISGGVDSRQAFGQLWEGARYHKGLKHQGGVIDILRQKGLLAFGAMLDPKKLAAALRQRGWTAKSIAALTTAIGAERMLRESGQGGDELPPLDQVSVTLPPGLVSPLR